MLTITPAQAAEVGARRRLQRLERMTAMLRADFPQELADRPRLDDEVRALADEAARLGFSEWAHVYRLVAWGLFLGPRWLHEAEGGRLLAIAREEAPEAARFARIRAVVTAPGFAYRPDEERGDAPDAPESDDDLFAVADA